MSKPTYEEILSVLEELHCAVSISTQSGWDRHEVDACMDDAMDRAEKIIAHSKDIAA